MSAVAGQETTHSFGSVEVRRDKCSIRSGVPVIGESVETGRRENEPFRYGEIIASDRFESLPEVLEELLTARCNLVDGRFFHGMSMPWESALGLVSMRTRGIGPTDPRFSGVARDTPW